MRAVLGTPAERLRVAVLSQFLPAVLGRPRGEKGYHVSPSVCRAAWAIFDTVHFSIFALVWLCRETWPAIKYQVPGSCLRGWNRMTRKCV